MAIFLLLDVDPATLLKVISFEWANLWVWKTMLLNPAIHMRMGQVQVNESPRMSEKMWKNAVRNV